MNKTFYFAFLLLILANTQVIRVPTISTTTINTTIIPTILPRTQKALLYHGTVDIQITEG